MTNYVRQDSGSGKVFPQGNPIPGINKDPQVFGRNTTPIPPNRKDDTGGVTYNPDLQKPPQPKKP